MKTQTQTPRSPSGAPNRLGWLFLIPLLALSLLAQTNEPELEIEHAAAVVTWPLSETNCILLSSANPDGPWYPCPDPVAYGPDGCQVAVGTTDHSRYFNLAEGQWFMDVFDGDLGGWTMGYIPSEWSNSATVEITGGHLHIYGTNAAAALCATVVWRTNLMLADFYMSIDILEWDETYPGDNPSVSLMGRIHPDSQPNGDTWAYAGILNAFDPENPDPSKSVLHLYEYTGAGQHYIKTDAFPRVDPAKDYRLVFYGVGPGLTVQLFNLTDGTLVAECQDTDTSRVNGSVAFATWDLGRSGTVDFWLDNFIAVGTTP